MKALRSLIIWTLVASVLAAAGAWLLWEIGCLYTEQTPLCRHDYGGAMVALAGVVLVVLPLAYSARRRAMRAVERGMYARPVGGRWPAAAGGWFENVMHFIVEGDLAERSVGDEQRGFHPLLDIPSGDGWRVPLENGVEVVVYWGDLREWLYAAWELQQNPANSRQGATSQRTWDARIGRDQVLARNHLLEIAGGLRRNRASANAKRRIEGTPWSILERLMAEWPPGEV